MPIGSRQVNLHNALEALDIARHTGRWTALAVLGHYCALFREQYGIDYAPKGKRTAGRGFSAPKPDWDSAFQKIRRCIEHVGDVERAVWCIWALFSRTMNWFTTKSPDKLADPELCRNPIWVTAVHLKERMEEQLERFLSEMGDGEDLQEGSACYDAAREIEGRARQAYERLQGALTEWKRYPFHPLSWHEPYARALATYHAAQRQVAEQNHERQKSRGRAPGELYLAGVLEHEAEERRVSEAASVRIPVRTAAKVH